VEAQRAALRGRGERAALSEPESDLGWLELQVDALFASDARGRLLHPRGVGGAAEPPPRFFFGRTRHGSLWRFAADLPEPLVAELARLAAAERSDWPQEDLPERMRTIRERLASHAPIVQVYHGPAFRFPALPAVDEAGVARLAPGSAAPIDEHFAWLAPALAECQPCVGAVADGAVRAVCHAARRGARAVEAGIETAPGFRGRGLATRAVAAWARAVAAEGKAPLYSTEFRNRPSRAVAARLGLTPYAVDLHLR
jgi:RimJ/RimL family protein N-acetyltransferase